MSLNILKTLGRFLIVFSPLLIAFAATFYILLPSQPSFTNFPMALIKILGAQSFTLLKKKYSQFSRYLLDHFLEGITAIKSLVVHQPK